MKEWEKYPLRNRGQVLKNCPVGLIQQESTVFNPARLNE